MIVKLLMKEILEGDVGIIDMGRLKSNKNQEKFEYNLEFSWKSRKTKLD